MLNYPHSRHNRALKHVADYVNSQLRAAHAKVDENVDNDGTDAEFDKLRGVIAALSGVSLELHRLERPDDVEEPVQPEQPVRPPSPSQHYCS